MEYEGLTYNGTDIYSDISSYAVVNTASVWMILPEPEFLSLSQALSAAGFSCNTTFCVSDQVCGTFYDSLALLKINMDDAVMLTVGPQGYLMDDYKGQTCVSPFYNMSETDIYVGQETIYVGAAIMRNFYFTIDYEDNEIEFMTSAYAPSTTSVAEIEEDDEEVNVVAIVVPIVVGVALIVGGIIGYKCWKKKQMGVGAISVESDAEVVQALYK